MATFNLIKLQHFFEVDARIKKEMYNNVPPEDYLDDNSLVKYTNNLEDSLIYIFSELKCIAQDVFGEKSFILKNIEDLEEKNKSIFYSCGFDIAKLRSYYKEYISNMNEEFIDQVKSSCVGYTSFNNPPITMAKSVNEILHLLHSYILNNDYLLQSIEVLAQKNNDQNEFITLRGNNVKIFNDLFEYFPTDLDVGVTDMVNINERKSIMMVRDRGHALTIEITLNNNMARLEYFIPKLCNIDMINALPGINKVNENSIGATGVIETDINYLPETLYNFIAHVPTDQDMKNNRLR